jgi:hypothetical protein
VSTGGSQPTPNQDHQDRHHRDLRDGVEADEQRIGPDLDEPRRAERDAEQEAEEDGEPEAGERHPERVERVVCERAGELPHRGEDQARRRQHEARDLEGAAGDLP